MVGLYNLDEKLVQGSIFVKNLKIVPFLAENLRKTSLGYDFTDSQKHVKGVFWKKKKIWVPMCTVSYVSAPLPWNESRHFLGKFG